MTQRSFGSDRLEEALATLGGVGDEVIELGAQLDHGGMWGPFFEAEARSFVLHANAVGQPPTVEAFRLWARRRTEGKCPVSDTCPLPKKGRGFCKWHARFER